MLCSYRLVVFNRKALKCHFFRFTDVSFNYLVSDDTNFDLLTIFEEQKQWQE